MKMRVLMVSHLLMMAGVMVMMEEATFGYAFPMGRIPSMARGRSSAAAFTTATVPLNLSSRPESMATPSPDEEAVREVYGQWRQRFNKGDFDSARYQNFKSNYMAVTAKNTMEFNRARQSGVPAPAPIQLNEYGDCSAEEYRAIMQQQSRGPPRTTGAIPRDPNTRIAPNSPGLQPTNDFNNPRRQQQQQQSPGTRQQQMTQASTQLRAAMDQRTKLESELMQLKQRLEEKQKLLQAAMSEEQYCKNRIALREEQKRLLNERLRNGWDDEKGLQF